MYTALQKLGFKSYHMGETFYNKEGSHPLWLEALEAKYQGKGRPYGKAEFEKLLGKYDVRLRFSLLNMVFVLRTDH